MKRMYGGVQSDTATEPYAGPRPPRLEVMPRKLHAHPEDAEARARVCDRQQRPDGGGERGRPRHLQPSRGRVCH
jgi:hypothetical protein